MSVFGLNMPLEEMTKEQLILTVKNRDADIEQFKVNARIAQKSIERLQNEEDRLSEMSKEMSRNNNAITEQYVAQLAERDERIKTAEAEAANLRGQYASLQQSYGELQTDFSNLDVEHHKLGEECDEKTKQLTAEAKKAGGIAGDYAILQSDHEELEKKHLALQNEMKSANDSNAEIQKLNADLGVQVEILGKLVDETNAAKEIEARKHQKIRYEHGLMRTELDEADDKVADLQKKLDAAQNSIRGSCAEPVGFDEPKSLMEEMLDKPTESIPKKQQLRDTKLELGKTLQQAAQTTDYLEKRILEISEDYKARIANLEATISGMEVGIIANLKNEVEARNEIIDEWKTEHKARRGQVEMLELGLQHVGNYLADLGRRVKEAEPK